MLNAKIHKNELLNVNKRNITVKYTDVNIDKKQTKYLEEHIKEYMPDIDYECQMYAPLIRYEEYEKTLAIQRTVSFNPYSTLETEVKKELLETFPEFYEKLKRKFK